MYQVCQVIDWSKGSRKHSTLAILLIQTMRSVIATMVAFEHISQFYVKQITAATQSLLYLTLFRVLHLIVLTDDY